MSSHPDNKRPAYDDFSDSDDDDEVDASSSPVTLGFADGSLPKSQDESSSTDKIGGLPSFWPVCETTPPDVQAGRCKACGAAMPLLAQINAPLDPEQCEDGTVLDQEDRMRVLFVFACIQKCCSGKPNRYTSGLQCVLNLLLTMICAVSEFSELCAGWPQSQNHNKSSQKQSILLLQWVLISFFSEFTVWLMKWSV